MSTNEQLAWDFDDGDVAEVRPDTGIARFAPGSEQWIAALQPTDDDAIRLDRFDVNTMTAHRRPPLICSTSVVCEVCASAAPYTMITKSA